MAKKTLLLKVEVELEDLEGEELEEANAGSGIDDEDCPGVTDYDAFEVGDVLASSFTLYEELWAGSEMFGKVNSVHLKKAKWLNK